MSFHVRDNFTAGPVSQVSAAWFNGVAKFLNNLSGGLGIRVLRDADPPQVALDVEAAKKALAVPSVCPNAVKQDSGAGDTTAEGAARAPAAVVQAYMDASGGAADETDAAKIVRIGTSKVAARADHVHRDPVIHQTRQTCTEMIEARNNGNGSITLTFYPPVYDPGGRFIGLSTDGVRLGTFLEDVI